MAASPKRLARYMSADKRLAAENIEALSLQARAWRILAIIGLVEPEFARKTAQWLLFNTVPFVNGPAIQKFIAENEARAEECGIKAGVFSIREVKGAA
jgi:hypothetical protein